MLNREQINEKLKNQKSRLKYFRELNNITIDKICRDTGINKNTYLRLEREPVYKGTIEIYLTLAEYYGTSVDYIIGNNVEPTCIVNYINKRTIDELNYKKEVYDQLTSVLTDEGLNLDQLTENIINLLKFSEKEIRDLKHSNSVIPRIILEKKAIKTYPYNLLAQIFSTEALTTDLYLTKELITNLDQLLDKNLTDVEAYVLKLRYVNELSLEKIAKIREISRERIRQIETKALRRLRHVAYTQALLQSTQISRKKREIESLDFQIKQKQQSMNELETNPANRSIEELPLNVRAYNSLKRAGINYIYDILKSINIIKMLKVKNLGMGSINHIMNILQELNYLDKDEFTFTKSSEITHTQSIKRLDAIQKEISLKYNL